jgi:hypothetical protein
MKALKGIPTPCVELTGPIPAFSIVSGAAPSSGTAAVNAPHSKRFANFADARQTRQRMECGDFSTAFSTR